MQIVANKICNYCKEPYTGYGKLFCSNKCRARNTAQELRKSNPRYCEVCKDVLTKSKLKRFCSWNCYKKNPVKYWKDKKFSDKYRKKLSLAHIGVQAKEKHPNWQGGINPIELSIRTSLEYKQWRKAVYERDNYTCVWCGAKGVRLEADHIKPFATHKELRFKLSNGRTLCKPCHIKTDTFGRRTKK